MPPHANAPGVVLLRNTFDNIGDMAMLESEIGAIKRLIPEARLTVLSDDRRLAEKYPELTWGESDVVLSQPVSGFSRSILRQMLAGAPRWANQMAGRAVAPGVGRYQARSIQRFLEAARKWAGAKHEAPLTAPERRLLKNLKNADLVIGGGSLIGHIPMIADPRRAVYQALRLLGVRYVLNGLSLTDDWGDETYSGAALVVVRDGRVSARRAIECGVTGERLLTNIDPAFRTPLTDGGDGIDRLQGLGLEPSRFVAANLRQGEFGDMAIDRMAVDAVETVKACGAKAVLLFGMQSFRDNNDKDLLEKLRERLRPHVSVAMWPVDAEYGRLVGVLAQARTVMSCRYHGALFALAAGVPAVGVIPQAAYDIKMRGLFAWYGLERFCYPLGEAIPQAVRSELATGHGALRQRIRVRNDELVREANRPYERIRGLLGLT